MNKMHFVLLAIIIGLVGCDNSKEPQSDSGAKTSLADQAGEAVSNAAEEIKENAELINENIESNEYANPASEKMAEAGKSIADSSSDAAETIDENLDSIKENIESNPPYPATEEQK